MSTCNLNISPNDMEILLRQIKRELEDLTNTTEGKLLKHDGKIAELCKYLKDNLSNTIRCMLDSMQLSGELDDILFNFIGDRFNDVGIRFIPLKGYENAQHNTNEFNALVNNLKTSLIDSENEDQKVKWSIPTINITLPEGEYYFEGFDIVQGLNLKGAGKNATIIHMLKPANIKYKYSQTLANGVGNVCISDIFFYGNHEKSIDCFVPELYKTSGRYAHLIYANIHDCSFYGFNNVFKTIGYNNSIHHNTFSWCNRCLMIYGYDGKGNVGGDWEIYSNSANNIKEFINSLFSSLIHAFDNWCYQGLGTYINLIGWNRGTIIEGNRLEDSTSAINIHGGEVVKYHGEIYRKVSKNTGDITGDTWEKINDYDINFIEPYNESKTYNILQAIAMMIRGNNLHTLSSDAIILKGGQYITIQDNFSGNYVKLSTKISDCQGLKYHNNMNIDYSPAFYDDYKDWKAINSFNLYRSLSVGTNECFVNACYSTASPRGINFRLNDKTNAFRILENGGMYLMNNAKVVTLELNSSTTIIDMDCINSQSVILFPRTQNTASWYKENLGNIFAECGNGNIAITHPSTTESITFNVIVI